MPNSPIVKRTAAQATAFRWLVRTLRTAPELRTLVRTWFESDGTPNEEGLVDPAAWQINVRITPEWEPEEWYCGDGTRQTYQCPVNVVIEEWTYGDHPDDAAGFWSLVRDALAPYERRPRTALHAAGISWIEWGAPGTLRLMVFVER